MESTDLRPTPRTRIGRLAFLIVSTLAINVASAEARSPSQPESSLAETHNLGQMYQTRSQELEQVDSRLAQIEVELAAEGDAARRDQLSQESSNLSSRKISLQAHVGRLGTRLGLASTNANVDVAAAPISTNSVLNGAAKLFGAGDSSDGSGNPAGPTSVAFGQDAPSSGGGGIMDMINGIVQSQGGWIPLVAGTAAGFAGWAIAGKLLGPKIGSKFGLLAAKMAASFGAQWLGTKAAKWFVNSTNGGRSIENWVNGLFGGKSKTQPQSQAGYVPGGQDPVQYYGTNKLYAGEAQLFGGTQSQPVAYSNSTGGTPATNSYGQNYSQTAASNAYPSPPVANARSATEAQQNMNFWYSQYQGSMSGDPRLSAQMYQEYLRSKTQLNQFIGGR